MNERLEKRIEELEKMIKDLQNQFNRIQNEKKFWGLRNEIENNRLNIELNYRLLSVKERFQLCLIQFGEIGVKLNDSIDYELLKRDAQWKDWQLDDLGFNEFKYYLLWLLGLRIAIEKSDYEEIEYIPISNQIWYLDFERDGDVEYGDFIERLNLLAENRFDFTKVENILRPTYGVKFKYGGKEYEWDFGHTDDWINWEFIKKMGNLPGVQKFDTGEKNYYIIPDGQGGIIHYNTESNIERLEKILGTGRNIEKLFNRK